MRRALVAIVVAGLLASAAQAEQMYARGDFNGWDTSAPLIDMGNGMFSATIDLAGKTPGSYYEFKVANADWSINYPTDNVKTSYPNAATLNINYIPAPAADGWNPADNRVGYSLAGNGWEIMGAFNGWASPVVALSDMGNGLYAADYLVVDAGTYEFKFRGTPDWEVSIGQNFGRFAPNASVTTASPNELIRFELDLPDGRWRTSVVPEPASLAGLALLGLLIRRR